MKILKSLILVLILITTPTFLAFPAVQVKEPKYKLKKCLKKERRFHHITYDQIVDLLEDIESGKAEKKYKKYKDQIDRFLAYLAKEGTLSQHQNIYALDQDIKNLLGNEAPFEYAYAASTSDDFSFIPAVYTGDQELILQTGSISKCWKKTKKFCKKHKKAIIIGIVVVVVVTTIVIVASASAGAAATAASGAAAGAAAAAQNKETTPFHTPTEDRPAIESLNDQPIYKQVAEEHIENFKHQIAEEHSLEQIGLKPEEHPITFREKLRDYGSHITHKVIDEVADAGEFIPWILDKDKTINYDNYPQFAPKKTHTEIYKEGVDWSHNFIDKAFKTDNAQYYGEDRIDPYGDLVIGEIPPPGRGPRLGKGAKALKKNEKISLAKEMGYTNKEISELQKARTLEKVITNNFENGVTDPEMVKYLKKYPNITIYEKNLKHIFRNADGHVLDSISNRQLLIETASSPKNFLGKDRFGNIWHAKLQKDGTQVWTMSRKGEIRNGGVNQQPRQFNLSMGLLKEKQ